ncbi:MAG TPA: hypothetical protein VK425_05745, partial [Acidimicrobiales bacterium]|nr:hypothetical protein [Acidimicrobiales bacterium]
LIDAVTQIVDANTAKVISMSVGECETGDQSFVNSMHELMVQAADQGQSVLVAAGDTGSEGCFSYSTSNNPPASGDYLSATTPASDPLVTAVGGTVITSNGELAWNDCQGTGNISCAETLGLGASGGGVSEYFTSGPSGQPVLSGAGGYREVPDVSAASGSNYGADVVLYTDGSWQAWLGTSLGTPLWAAIVADRDTTCSPGTGDFDPELYSLYTNNYSSAFNSIPDGYNPSSFAPETGSNDFTQDQSGKYATAASYDMVTGVGSPDAPGLACSQVLGPYDGQSGQQLVLDGVGLENASIFFGASQAQVLSASATTATVDVPSGSGQVAISARGPLGQSSLTASFTYEGGGTTTTTSSTTTTTAPTTTTSTTTTTTPPTTTTSSTTTTTRPTTTTSSTTTTRPTTTTSSTTTTTTTPTTTTSTTSPTTTSTTVAATTTTGQGGEGPPGGGFGGFGGFGGLLATTTTSSTSTTTSSTTTTTAPPRVKTGGRSAHEALGFWMVANDGGVFRFGQASYYGSLPAMKVHVSDIVAVTPAPGGTGYWMAAGDGRVYHFGRAANFGSLPGRGVQANNVVAMTANANGGGYWLLTASGKVSAFGHAVSDGSVVLPPGAGRLIGIASSPDGRGYWVASSTGMVWHFGDAAELGSLKSGRASPVIVAIAASPEGEGYWLVARNGSIFSFGAAPRFKALVQGTLPVVGVAPTADGEGLWVVSANGAVLDYGDAVAEGSLPGLRVLTESVVAVAPL